MSHRTIAVGDIHGCATALDSLLRSIDPKPDDTLITLGDYIDRGPNSRAVIDKLILLAGQCRLIRLVGNHEEMLMQAWSDKAAIKKWLEVGGVDTLRSYGWVRGGAPRPLREWFPRPHQEFIEGCQSYWETPTHIFVHAGVLPDLALNQQPAAALRWRVASAENALPHCSQKTVVVGHTPQFSGDILDLGHLVCIDTNCVRRGWLTAVNVESGQIWQANQAGETRKNRLRSATVRV
ncbi:MAG TPA: metallophosphoesterase family protein [Gemmataceae bacterium]|jgi:serine/threonine protein phosphatase 1|nr:metallophosphoesterase family protein [Gemmataceae bacterium]